MAWLAPSEEIYSSRVSVSSKSYTRGHVDALRSLLMLLARRIYIPVRSVRVDSPYRITIEE